MGNNLAENSPLLSPGISAYQPQNPVIRLIAKIISYIFHPLFVPVYIAWFLVRIEPYLFSSFSPAQKAIALLRFFLIYSFFPLVSVLLCKALGFVSSVFLRSQRERAILYIITMIYYFWMAYVLRHQPEFAKETVLLAMAIFIASVAGLLTNIYMKVSMHAMSMGILVMFMAILPTLHAGDYTVYISLAVFIAGLVCTSRLVVSDHAPKEIYAGLLIGACCQLLAVWADGVLP